MKLTRQCITLIFAWVILSTSSISLLAKSGTTSSIPLNELKALTEAYYQIKTQYVKEVDDSVLLQAAIQGMVSSLDSHSRFLPADEFEQFNRDNSGEYAGVGLSFNDHEYGLQVNQVISNSPAARQGITPGMLVTHINQTAVIYLSANEALTMLKGKVGTWLELTVTAPHFAQPKEIKLRRETLLLPSIVSHQLSNATAYIQIQQFTMNTAREFKQALATLNKASKIERLIIDLRDNPGGDLEVAIELSDLFIKAGNLLISVGRTPDANQTYRATAKAPFAHYNTVIMINAGSASASEVFAGALKDHGKALILGEKSYGKGSIQSVVSLTADSGMKFTTAEYFSPSGARIQDLGITPDVISATSNLKNPSKVTLLDDLEILQAYNLLNTPQ
ncbi:S41 family peptidase [Aliikangiella sp. IMCC44632]